MASTKERKMEDIVCVILAAGLGKRMQGEEKQKQKVLVKIQKKPMLGYVLKAVSAIGIRRVVVVVGHQGRQVEQYLEGWRDRLDIQTVRQERLLGTADAVKQTKKFLTGHRGDILVLYGDTPLLTERTLRHLITEHRAQKNDCTLLTTLMQDPTGYGRIVRNGRMESVEKIVEEVDATPEEKAVQEINVGAYCFRLEGFFGALKEVKPDNRKHEYYLTDTIAILSKRQKVIRSILTGDRYEVLGVNSPTDLVKARHVFNKHTTYGTK